MMRRSKLSFKPRLEVLEDHLCPSGSGGSVPPGTIYYTDYKPLQGPAGWYDSFNGNDSMKADGTNKTALPNFPSSGEPSRLLHPDRWVLDLETVPGSYPNGLQRAEVFGTRLSDGFKLQLTNNPSVEPIWSRRWAFNDSFLSFDAVTWTPGTTGGDTTFTASSGQQWQGDAGIFRAAVTWTSGSPTAIAPT